MFGLNALSSIVCFLTSTHPISCTPALMSLNALSSIVCFLTKSTPGAGISVHIRLNALSSIVCFLTQGIALSQHPNPPGSQCPLEHCMLSDTISRRTWTSSATTSQCPLEHCMLSDEYCENCSKNFTAASQCPLEHCMLSDESGRQRRDTGQNTQVSMPSRALYAF